MASPSRTTNSLPSTRKTVSKRSFHSIARCRFPTIWSQFTTSVLLKTNAQYETQIIDQTQGHIVMPQRSTREKVAISFRIHTKNGHGSGVAEQITASADPKEGALGTHSFGLGLKEAAVK